jgi:hypothetical protein
MTEAEVLWVNTVCYQQTTQRFQKVAYEYIPPSRKKLLSTKEKMDRPAAKETEQAWNGLYPVANEDCMRLTKGTGVYNIRLSSNTYSPLLCVTAKALQHRCWQELHLKKECVETCKM